MNLVGVIPARMGATRCPGKPLIKMSGKPMVQWVFEAAKRCAVFDAVIIATPDQEIVEAAKRFGADAVLTSSSHPTGTDRIAEAARNVRASWYVNIQGDEPLMPVETIERCAALTAEGKSETASVYDWAREDEIANPNVVKVVTDLQDRALYFSRSEIPFARGRREKCKKHIGIYGYSYDVLQRFSQWEPTPLEISESLEQLRFLEHGVGMQMSWAAATPLAVDTPEQAEAAARLLEEVRA